LATFDAEVLQEMIHLYRARFREVLPITGAIMDHAKDLVNADQTISARDAVHAAGVVLHKLEGICTLDRDFERIPGCTRIDP
jgi:predicted nucleic acid-binding protein